MQLTFFRGIDLEPQPPGASKFEGVRYFKIHEGEDWDATQVSDWVLQASKLPGAKLW